RLMVAMPSPVEPLRGEMNSPIDCLAPMVTKKTAAAANVTSHAPRSPDALFAGMWREGERSGAPCFVGLQMRIGSRKHRALASVHLSRHSTPQKIADDVVGFDRRMAFHITQH